MEVQANGGFISALMRNSNLEVRIAGSSCRLQLDEEQSMLVDLDSECGKECHEYDKCSCSRLLVPTHLFYFIIFFLNYFSGTVRISCIAPAIDDLWGNLVLFPGLSGITLTQEMIIVVINLFIYIFFTGCLS